YTPQAPPPAPAASWALLAAGDARHYSAAWAAFAAHVGWRRVAVLSELATRAALDVTDLAADVLVHVELPADTDDLDLDKITQWAVRAATAHARILYVCAEDARVVRAALCAGRAAGLAPPAVWLLPGALPPAWLRPPASDTHNCTHQQLRDMAEGHLSVAPAWLADWDERSDASADSEEGAWRRQWRSRCLRARACGRGACGACGRAPGQAALLYDALRMWDAALRRQLRAHPAALDNLHHESIARALIKDVTTSSYSGLTGKFEWSEDASGARVRLAPVVVQQWSNGTRRRLGVWSRAAGAVLALAALALAALLGASAAAACHCKRRAERKYRARLAALGLTRLDPKPGGLDRWEIPRERVVINRKLGTGAFGTVYGGHALLAEDRGWSAVAVKTLKAGATTEEKLDFLSEAEAMKRFDHKNVVRLLGVVTKTEPVCTVMEFMLYGDLKNYLLARRHLAAAGAGEADEVSAPRLTAMALDAARGLSYLAQLRYVHRDVAARNCLVSAQRVVKLADFGMTRLVFEHDYYRFSRKGMLPVRWMAPESLALGVFSPASDVWSFGVLLYEIVTFGSLPFQGLSNAEVLARVKAGHTLELPPGLKPQLEGLIKSCWQAEHKARPSAAEVAAFLADSPRLLAPCLDLPLDALPLDLEPWQHARDRAEARWVSWGAPASGATDTTYLSADAPPADTDAFLS
ncbi:ephrin type-A receptor 4-like, partial [Spodoptera litura]|uniref:receptor protein-tyrosine kinase n=1 Tax=Spodoptera litura TaxID=69820 RepID=A0A9J7E2D0_SPOLT